MQILCHAEGHVPAERDYRDIEPLAERFGLELPPQFRRPMPGDTGTRRRLQPAISLCRSGITLCIGVDRAYANVSEGTSETLPCPGPGTKRANPWGTRMRRPALSIASRTNRVILVTLSVA